MGSGNSSITATTASPGSARTPPRTIRKQMLWVCLLEFPGVCSETFHCESLKTVKLRSWKVLISICPVSLLQT